MNEVLQFNVGRDNRLSRGRVVVNKGKGEKNFSIKTGEDGFNTYDKMQIEEFVRQMEEITGEKLDPKDKKTRKELLKFQREMERAENTGRNYFYFRIPKKKG